MAKGYAAADANLVFCHSDTADGQAIGRILEVYFRRAGHSSVQARTITDLQDRDPRLFRTRGLRNLAREVCKVIRDYGAASCAINATGGYKAQIAIAVLMGQALGVPVYYKHELFDEIIAFPPMPVAFDFEAWMRLSGLLLVLQADLQPADLVEDYPDDAETLESLVDRETVDGVDYLELSPTGQIFHETFRERFRTTRDQVLPPPVPTGQKKPPHFEDSGHMHAVRGLKAFLGSGHGRRAPGGPLLDVLEPSRPAPARPVLGRRRGGRGPVQRRQGPGQVPGRDKRDHPRPDGGRRGEAERVAAGAMIGKSPRKERIPCQRCITQARKIITNE